MQGCMSDITQTSHCHWCRSLDAGLSYWFALFGPIILSSQIWWVSLHIRLQGFRDSQFLTWNFWTLFFLWVHMHTSSFMKRVYSGPLEAIPKHPLPRYYTTASVQPRELQFPDATWCLLQNSAMGILPLEKVLQLSSRMNDGFCGTKEKTLCGVSKQQQKQQKTPQKPTLSSPQTLMKH